MRRLLGIALAHGTGVAGIIAARDNGIYTVGVAPGTLSKDGAAIRRVSVRRF
jgi:subtilisin family serine protease